MLFLGEYRVNFSGQGRVVVPKRIREALGTTKSFTLTKGFDRCLSGFRNEEWEKGASDLMSNSVLEMQKVEMKRHLFSGATTLEIDDQGRIIIPKNLVEYAGLIGDDVILIGVGTYFEIWNPEKWKEYSQNIEKNIKSIVQSNKS
ncbi:MAG: division/cell wall cluster transcriptional repressor MraZ [bacterium]|nr:division/cell wall cluster transcriptional repressor MraZ [bacterium]